MRTAALLLPLLLAAPARAQPDPAALDRLVQAALKDWQVPGLALVVVHEDRVVYLKGHGVKALGKPDPVTPDTVFPLASCTKPFTTLALAMLADDDKLDWDDPVRRHLPGFKLSDPLADANVTLRDLVTHRTGVGGHEPLWYHAPWPPEERLKKLAHVEPDHGFREKFEYQTVLFGAAGLAAGKAAESSWEAVVAGRILGPLGMASASCVAPDPSKADLAAPHRADAKGRIESLPRYPLADPDPAGSLHASARDLGAFLRFQLGDGTWQGRRLISERRLKEPHAPQVIIPMGEFTKVMNPDTKFLTYGMGWIVQDYRGHQIFMHGGAIDGFRAHLTLVPEAKLGIGLLNNLNGTFLNLALSGAIVDQVLGLPARNWSGYYRKIQADEDRERWAEIGRLRAQVTGAAPARPPAAYVGEYVDRAYGPCRVEAKDGGLVWSWGRFRVPLAAAGPDAFLADGGPVVALPVTFRLGADGRADAVRVFDRVFRRRE